MLCWIEELHPYNVQTEFLASHGVGGGGGGGGGGVRMGDLFTCLFARTEPVTDLKLRQLQHCVHKTLPSQPPAEQTYVQTTTTNTTIIKIITIIILNTSQSVRLQPRRNRSTHTTQQSSFATH